MVGTSYFVACSRQGTVRGSVGQPALIKDLSPVHHSSSNYTDNLVHCTINRKRSETLTHYNDKRHVLNLDARDVCYAHLYIRQMLRLVQKWFSLLPTYFILAFQERKDVLHSSLHQQPMPVHSRNLPHHFPRTKQHGQPHLHERHDSVG